MSVSISFVAMDADKIHNCPAKNSNASFDVCKRCRYNFVFPTQPLLGCGTDFRTETVDDFYRELKSIDPINFERFKQILNDRHNRGRNNDINTVEPHTADEVQEISNIMIEFLAKMGEDYPVEYLHLANLISTICQKAQKYAEPIAILYSI